VLCAKPQQNGEENVCAAGMGRQVAKRTETVGEEGGNEGKAVSHEKADDIWNMLTVNETHCTNSLTTTHWGCQNQLDTRSKGQKKVEVYQEQINGSWRTYEGSSWIQSYTSDKSPERSDTFQGNVFRDFFAEGKGSEDKETTSNAFMENWAAFVQEGPDNFKISRLDGNAAKTLQDESVLDCSGSDAGWENDDEGEGSASADTGENEVHDAKCSLEVFDSGKQENVVDCSSGAQKDKILHDAEPTANAPSGACQTQEPRKGSIARKYIEFLYSYLGKT
jgi:hypothetical protein